MTSTRRDLFVYAGGSAVGALLTPAPWRLITDTALWSENWPGVPAPLRGEIRTRFTNCSLCRAGCAVRARCVGDQPVQLAGVASHPLSRGALCPFGLTGHHLPYHPARLKPGMPGMSSAEQALAAVSAAISATASAAIPPAGGSGRIAVLDLRPGRAASWTYRRAMAALNGVYLTQGQPVAFDLHQAKTVLSFGVPVLDGWGTPGNVWAARPGFRLIQAEPIQSRTAALADVWLPIQPDTEDALAQAIADAIRQADAVQPGTTPLRSWLRSEPRASASGAGTVGELANELMHNGPALVLDNYGSAAVMALNQLLGAAAHTVVARPEAPVPDSWTKAAPATGLAQIEDRSIAVLLIDESAVDGYLPWHTIERKLVRDNPVVVTFATGRGGYARHARFALPAAVYPEFAEDIPTAIDSPAATFRLSVPLVAPPSGMVNPAEFIAALAGLAKSDTLRERADAIHQAGRGTLFTPADGKTVAVKSLTAEAFWKSLGEAGCWI
ncbi:MAG TPA: hypothetical protein VKJ01_25835, partial [Candidatus Solibacter sp.]|nr:hypothetical protein [Candidatus Solibacter sp.]